MLFLVIFIAWHIWETRIQKALGAEVNFDMMADILSSPFMLAFYIAGVIAATFHFQTDLWSFLSHGELHNHHVHNKSLRTLQSAVFLVLSVIGVQALLAFTLI